MNARSMVSGCLLLLCLSVPAKAAETCTSSRQISAVAIASDGSLWAATRGGVLLKTPDGTWRKFTVMDGLPSNEITSIMVDNNTVTAITPEAAVTYADGRWSVTALKQRSKPDATETASTTWNSRECVATISELRIVDNGKRQVVKLPPGRGSHISALTPYKNTLWAAMFGDGIWEYNGKTWSRPGIGLPAEAREITCMASAGGSVWIGTRNDGLWSYDGKSWRQSLIPDEPYDHNCQSIASYNGNIYISTLEDGLVVKTPTGWIHYSAGTLSSNAPRQLAVSNDCLYVRHGNGRVDRFDGRTWARDVCAKILRKQVSALASDGRRLFAGQWGGWSEYDGRTWKHNLKIPQLQGYVVTALSRRGDTLWIGTQGRGLAEYDTISGKLTWHDETNGLTDDWIKVISDTDPMLVGSFAGGLSIGSDGKWTAIKEFNGMEITAIVSNFPSDGSFIGTRNGLFYRHKSGEVTPVCLQNGQKIPEVQTLLRSNETLWIGTRTGLYSIPTPFYAPPKPFETILNKTTQ